MLPISKVLLFTLIVIFSLTLESESGKIVRTWRRRDSNLRRSFQPHSFRTSYHRRNPWGGFFRRKARMSGKMPPQNSHSNEKDAERRSFSLLSSMSAEHTPHYFHHGFPTQRDPTTAYSPPSNENVHFNKGLYEHQRKIAENNRRRRPPPSSPSHISIWKYLAMKQRRRFRPPPFHQHRAPLMKHTKRPTPVFTSQEAEISPNLANVQYFRPKDYIPKNSIKSHEKTTGSSTLLKEKLNIKSHYNRTVAKDEVKKGYVTDVPLYPTQSSAASEFKPIAVKLPAKKEQEDFTKVVVDEIKLLSDYLFKEEKSTTEPEISTTHRTLLPPDNVDSTESLLTELLKTPPAPINSFNINIQPEAEGSGDFLKIVPIVNSFTQSHSESTTTKTTTTTTLRPIFSVKVISAEKEEEKEEVKKEVEKEDEIKEEVSVLDIGQKETEKEQNNKKEDIKEEVYIKPEEKKEEKITTTLAPRPTYKWPTMKPYVKSTVVNKKPIYTPSVAKNSKKEAISSSSGESSITITGIRSKVSNYKSNGLLNFDKVADSKNSTKNSSSTTEESKMSTTVSPMQNFDPMKMIHSWLTKASSSSSSVSTRITKRKITPESNEK